MNDIIKKSILFGLGTYEVTKEKVEEFVEKLKVEEKITPEEGKKLVEGVMTDLEKEGKEYRAKTKKLVQEVLEELGVATKADIEALKKSLKK